ncbi:MAG: NAD(P)H-hydrate dehydratase, partial [Dehalococcoidaceae bacterium]|nr:NAD(P)H-hydrate dehydratase [Dehalococcoidaceae bacterium]
QMIAMEQEAVRQGISVERLMENAGLKVADNVRQIAGGIRGKGITFLIGPGNNGGDGLVAARHLAEWGALVNLVIPAEKPANSKNLELALQAGARKISSPVDCMDWLDETGIIVDAFFGTGRRRPIEGDFRTILQGLKAAVPAIPGLIVTALDVPSGLDSDTGAIDPSTLAADYTLTLGQAKTGLYNSVDAIAAGGQIRVLDIGIPPATLVETQAETIERSWAMAKLPERPRYAHKSTFGKVLMVAGSKNYTGAAFLAAAAAMRTGAGLVTLAVPESLQPAISSRLAEATFLPLPENRTGITHRAAELITASLRDYTVLLIGCGLGQSPEAEKLVRDLLLDTGLNLPPTVIDADALTILARMPGWPEKLSSNAILTPHPGEMGRLCGLTAAEVQSDRLNIATRAAREWGTVVVLKGAYTVIASPEGKTRVNPFSSPALASAGTGDVLAGIISALMAQGLDTFEAASLGVFLHAGAGGLAAGEIGDAGALAGDLLELIPRVIKNLKQNRVQ